MQNQDEKVGNYIVYAVDEKLVVIVIEPCNLPQDLGSNIGYQEDASREVLET